MYPNQLFTCHTLKSCPPPPPFPQHALDPYGTIPETDKWTTENPLISFWKFYFSSVLNVRYIKYIFSKRLFMVHFKLKGYYWPLWYGCLNTQHHFNKSTKYTLGSWLGKIFFFFKIIVILQLNGSSIFVNFFINAILKSVNFEW